MVVDVGWPAIFRALMIFVPSLGVFSAKHFRGPIVHVIGPQSFDESAFSEWRNIKLSILTVW